jgi:hypothetical protein
MANFNMKKRPKKRQKTDDEKLDDAVKKTGMTRDGMNRNKLWRIAEMERKMTLNEGEIW